MCNFHEIVVLEVDIFYAYIATCGIPGTIHNPKFPILFSAPPDCHMFLRLCTSLVGGTITKIYVYVVQCLGFQGPGHGIGHGPLASLIWQCNGTKNTYFQESSPESSPV